jgi:hypothetical protein
VRNTYLFIKSRINLYIVKLKPITDPTEFIVRIPSPLSNPLIDGLEPSEPLSIKSAIIEE